MNYTGRYNLLLICFAGVMFLFSCEKDGANNTPPPVNPEPLSLRTIQVDEMDYGTTYYNVNNQPALKLVFSTAVRHTSVDSSLSFTSKSGADVACNVTYANGDSTLLIQPKSKLAPITQYVVNISTALRAQSDGALQSPVAIHLTTAIDSSDKFQRITDSALLDVVQKQTFTYFWDFGHPVSGMARERNTSGDVCTTGGTGFGIMSILVAIHRHFISRAEGLQRVQKIVSFLTDKCTRYHGAFAHWINGATGETIPFSSNDDGADLVETSLLMQGLLCARQYFDQPNAGEDSVRKQINALWNGVEWNWFAPDSGAEGGLYWHWSPDKAWAMNMKITGWNEALITYVLAASANMNPIAKTVYEQGWARNGAMKNGKEFFGVTLPLGPDYGGPLFFSQYSFLGLDPRQLSDQYADYWTQNTAQAKINYLYCTHNPKNYNGYSKLCWGLTASDDNVSGYGAHSPTNDPGIISPTAAISSLPYTPVESMDALKFFYYKLGDKLWGSYGFKDAFNLTDVWFAESYLAIDQGPQIVMIENYRSGLLWQLFMSCPEIQRGLDRLSFSIK